ncbi:hypothetical protein SAMN05216525_119113 [Bradyrhizobium sp. Gha]|nr:hypothetical protein SAMN05216525_119113 [Bradyrhizobium sp. Gha]
MHRRHRPKMRQFNRISGVAMANADQIEETTREASTALVPLTPVLQWVRKMPLTRPDPSFVTQLIANAEHLPQASQLRRGSSDDARMAYGSKRPLPSVSSRTRQVA